RQMAETPPKSAFVLISGDFLAHRFREEFDAAAKDHSDAAYRIFVRKTMQFLGQQLEQTFPGTTILPALGNNDEECGDYQLQPAGCRWLCDAAARRLPRNDDPDVGSDPRHSFPCSLEALCQYRYRQLRRPHSHGRFPPHRRRRRPLWVCSDHAGGEPDLWPEP